MHAGAVGSAGGTGLGLPQSRVPTLQGLAGTQATPGVHAEQTPARHTALVLASQTVASATGVVPVMHGFGGVHAPPASQAMHVPLGSHAPAAPVVVVHGVPAAAVVSTVHTGPLAVQV